ncbi:hypothetical protein [Shewanella sp. HL-SH2]|uniref:hypothetical protein n=1 Tax=Shewanella sp. HL-SH2 TaxID=3436238 RepID=UPI003EC00D6B
MTEYEAYIKLIMMLGLVLSMPFFYRVCFLLGKIFILKFFPPKYLTIEVKRLDGSVELTKVKISDNEALVDALLHSTGRQLS